MMPIYRLGLAIAQSIAQAHAGRSTLSCPVRQNYVALALAGFGTGFATVIVDKGLGVDLRQACGLASASQPRKHFTPLLRSRSIAA